MPRLPIAGARGAGRWTEHDGLRFELRDGHARLTGFAGTARSEVVVPSSVRGHPVTVIARGAFEDQHSLRSMTIPSSVTILGASAFRACVSLETIELPGGVTTINAKAFAECTSLRSVVLPHELRRIAAHAFAGCRSLAETPHRVWIGPRHAGRIHDRMLEQSFPTTLEHIGEGAFEGCESLTRVVIPYRVTRIRASSFAGCLALRELWLHAAVAEVDAEAFARCGELARVRVATGTVLAENAFDVATTIVVDPGSPAEASARRSGNPVVLTRDIDDPVDSAFAATSARSPAALLADPVAARDLMDRLEIRPPLDVVSDPPDPYAGALDEPRFRRDPSGVYRSETTGGGESRLRIALTGDLMCGPRQQASAWREDGFDFSASFEHVRPFLRAADLTIGNLETTVAASYPLTRARGYVEDRPYFNAPFGFLAAVRNAGFDAVTNAQNHMYDTGPRGVVETLDALNRAGLIHGGMYVDAREPRYVLIEHAGITVGVVAYLDPSRQRMKRANFSAAALSAMTSPIDDAERIRFDISAARDAGAEFVLAICHWGREYTHEITARQQRLAQAVADAGADYIFGAHSHCLQPYAHLEAADGRSVPVVFSGGNFVSDMTRFAPATADTLIGHVTLARDPRGRVVVAEDGYLPCRILADAAVRGAVRVVPIDMLREGAFGYDAASAQDDLQRIGHAIGEPYRVLTTVDLLERDRPVVS